MDATPDDEELEVEEEEEEYEGPESVYVPPDLVYIPDEEAFLKATGALAVHNTEHGIFFLTQEGDMPPRWISFDHVKVQRAKLVGVKS